MVVEGSCLPPHVASLLLAGLYGHFVSGKIAQDVLVGFMEELQHVGPHSGANGVSNSSFNSRKCERKGWDASSPCTTSQAKSGPRELGKFSSLVFHVTASWAEGSPTWIISHISFSWALCFPGRANNFFLGQCQVRKMVEEGRLKSSLPTCCSC